MYVCMYVCMYACMYEKEPPRPPEHTSKHVKSHNLIYICMGPTFCNCPGPSHYAYISFRLLSFRLLKCITHFAYILCHFAYVTKSFYMNKSFSVHGLSYRCTYKVAESRQIVCQANCGVFEPLHHVNPSVYLHTPLRTRAAPYSH